MRICAPFCGPSPGTTRGGDTGAHAVLAREDRQVNRKKVQRLWREEGLRVPAKRRKRQRLGDSTAPAARLRAERIATSGR
jgi:putative transposase